MRCFNTSGRNFFCSKPIETLENQFLAWRVRPNHLIIFIFVQTVFVSVFVRSGCINMRIFEKAPNFRIRIFRFIPDFCMRAKKKNRNDFNKFVINRC